MLVQVAGQQCSPVGDDQEGGAPVVGLAQALVSIQRVAGGTGAVVASLGLAAAHPTLGVGAHLGAHPGWVTLIGVSTGPGVVHERLAAGTGAQGASGGLDTAMGAAGLGAAAVIQVTVGTLVSAIGTVSLAIADADQRDADVRGMGVGTAPCALPTRGAHTIAGVLGLALVTVVTTVILTVTNVRLEHALVIVTLVVVGRAVHGAAGAGLVALVLAVRGPVTIPALGHADPALLTLELGLGVALVGSQHRTALLVTAIVTVRDAVTFIRLMDTLLQVATFEL